MGLKTSASLLLFVAILCVYLGTDNSSVVAEPGAPAAKGKPVPLFNSDTRLEPATIEDTPTALITRVADRSRDRHSREWMFHNYDHYLALYWEHRTHMIEIVDQVAKGGKTITFNFTTLWPVNADLRAFFDGGGIGVAQYAHNMRSTRVDKTHYTTSIWENNIEKRPIKIGDRVEIEFSPFLEGPPRGRENYYGTSFLYIAGQGGMVPWEWHEEVSVAQKKKGRSLDSFPLPEMAWLGGRTTVSEQYSDEPKARFDQMALNISPINSQPFMLGRRLVHTDFSTGIHSEKLPDNPVFTEVKGKLGARFAERSCIACSQAKPPDVGKPLLQYLVKVGSDAKGTPHPQLGSVLQPQAAAGATPEGSVSISAWATTEGTYGDGTKFTLQKPEYKFTGVVPEFYSIRLAVSKPIGMGLLEAVDEGEVAALAATNGGHMNLVTDPETGQVRMGATVGKPVRPA